MSNLTLGSSFILNSDYSTTETKTGARWIDGKPIYRKVFTDVTSSTAGGNYYQVIPQAECGTIVFYSALMKDPSAIINISTWDGTPHDVNTWMTDSSLSTPARPAGTLCVYTSTSRWCGQRFWITVEYTKTTD